MDKNKKLTISIIGAGNVGTSLGYCFSGRGLSGRGLSGRGLSGRGLSGRGLSNQGHSVRLISRKPTQAAQRLSDALAIRGQAQPDDLKIEGYPTSLEGSDVVLLCVPDRAIESTCESVADLLSGEEIVAHCSGLLDSGVLKYAKQRGCSTASAHPLNTFPNLDASLDLLNREHNSYLYCEGDETALSMIGEIFGSIGFNTRTIDARSKTLYHAACVFASNYLTLLMDMSMQTAQAANIDQQEFFKACQPIINATLANLETQPAAMALSGPLARGDHETVNRHMSALSERAPELAEAYQLFADHGANLLKR